MKRGKCQLTECIIQQLLARERWRRTFQTLTSILKPAPSRGLARIDIPSTTIEKPYPVGLDPKSWNGLWTLVNDPDTVSAHVCAANVHQYNQAINAPFGSGPLAELLGP
jgi:hypothetical protein